MFVYVSMVVYIVSVYKNSCFKIYVYILVDSVYIEKIAVA